MQSQLHQRDGYWYHRMAFQYPMSRADVWEYLTKTEKLSSWFPELEASEKAWHFVMVDFREDLPFLECLPEKKLAVQWDQAVVTFSLTEDGLVFQEKIPVSYQNEFADAIKDMVGWAVHMERLEALFNGESLPDFEPLIAKWEKYLRQESAKYVL